MVNWVMKIFFVQLFCVFLPPLHEALGEQGRHFLLEEDAEPDLEAAHSGCLSSSDSHLQGSWTQLSPALLLAPSTTAASGITSLFLSDRCGDCTELHFYQYLLYYTLKQKFRNSIY